jgi:predicted DsbA family dithiol-disulfide isomerase
MTEAEVSQKETAGPASIIIVSDFVCPWCYVGLVEIERLSAEYDFQVRLAPFLLRPETPPEGMPARHRVGSGEGRSELEERGERLGIKFARGREWTSNSHLALEGSQFAHEYGDAWRYHRAMFKAYFEDLEDIGRIDTVVRVGESAGLDANSLGQALEEGIFRPQVDEGIDWSRRIGVTAIPTFIFNGQYAMVGAHELDALRYAMEQVGQAPRPTS